MPCQSVVVGSTVLIEQNDKDNMDVRQQDTRQVLAMQLMQYHLKTDITDDAFTRKKLADLVDSHRKLQKLQLLHTE